MDSTRRRRIGLIFSYNPQWIAGTYYVQNLVHALSILDDELKPIIVVVCNDDYEFDYLKETTSYPFLEKRLVIDRTIAIKFINKCLKKIFKRSFFNKKVLLDDLDALFPVSDNYEFPNKNRRNIYWVPDFQEDYLPDLFHPKDISNRKTIQYNISNTNNKLILSSNDALMDFNRLYPYAKCKTFVMPFAVTLPDYSSLLVDDVLFKFKVAKDRKYYFCANQFWGHKNHMIVLEAIKIMRDNGIDVLVLFSGNTSDYRNAHYYSKLVEYVKENDLQNNVQFLGFINREEQLILINHSVAIIQPSLFEGWSTVVEDAKALGKYIVLSSLKVHKEQISNNVVFFNPHNSVELSELLSTYLISQPVIEPYYYQNNIREFAMNFIKIIESDEAN